MLLLIVISALSIDTPSKRVISECNYQGVGEPNCCVGSEIAIPSLEIADLSPKRGIISPVFLGLPQA